MWVNNTRYFKEAKRDCGHTSSRSDSKQVLQRQMMIQQLSAEDVHLYSWALATYSLRACPRRRTPKRRLTQPRERRPGHGVHYQWTLLDDEPLRRWSSQIAKDRACDMHLCITKGGKPGMAIADCCTPTDFDRVKLAEVDGRPSPKPDCTPYLMPGSTKRKSIEREWRTV